MGDEARAAGSDVVQVEGASAGTGVILTSDPGARHLATTAEGGQARHDPHRREAGADLREQLGVKTMKTPSTWSCGQPAFSTRDHVTETKDGEYVINADRCPWFGGMGHDGVPGWDVKPCAAFSTYEKAMVSAINPNVKLSYTEKRTTGGHTCRGVYQYKDKELGDGPAEGVQPEMVSLGRKPEKS